jgi:hypothetical protein
MTLSKKTAIVVVEIRLESWASSISSVIGCAWLGLYSGGNQLVR